MFAGVEGIQTAYIWCGVIWAMVCGLAAGNYACSLIHRLPRGKSLLGDAPYCGSCAAPLQPKDLFPVFSALWLRHRCRYCGTSYPISHTVTEIVVAALFVLVFLQYNFSDSAVLLLTIGTFLVILAAIQVNENIIMGKIIACVLVAGMLLRVLLDHSLFGFVQGGLFGLILGALIWRKKIVKDGHIYRLPKEAELMTMAGVCVGAAAFPKFVLLFAGVYIALLLASKLFGKPMRITIAYAIALMLALVYPSLLNT